MNKNILSVLVVGVIVGVASFYGGMKYDQSKTMAQRQGRLQQFGGANISGGFRNGNGGVGRQGDFVSGDIIAKDEKSITIKMRDGGSKIVFFSDSTEVGKFVSGTSSDLVVGKSVTVMGKANQDGSLTAQSLQIRPMMPSPIPTK